MQSKPVTPDALRQDLDNVRGFLRALAALLPGRVDEELLAFLDSARDNPLSLELLARSLSAPR